MKSLLNDLVVAISGSDASIYAAKYAIILAKQNKCSLTAVYVIDTATLKHLMMTRIFVQEESAEYERGLEANGNRYLAFIRELAAAKGVKIDTELRRGAVYSEILSVADERDADCIILGGWESGRPSRDIISQAHRDVLVDSKCSVLVVKEPNVDQLYRAL
jgi:nucleotide-binding universal stress UspA family protein